ncbi:uncharacterized protein HD556DRAFT_1311768 [Suillus plorans]|uniref:Uncharacterized protein n=1 Tax=Suillus plorans TaxID=116603 RepID=A0A9P7AGD5_9AGAM|nr:uncharacterized protein HD556DRAFT_1311768 [Suillus plorans]KAG1788848.1 hypothetical protein HD556DRAFT_1311768 [Suillus plorans]
MHLVGLARQDETRIGQVHGKMLGLMWLKHRRKLECYNRPMDHGPMLEISSTMMDGPGGILFLMEAGGPMWGICRVDEWADGHGYSIDGWAKVVGYYVDGCTKTGGPTYYSDLSPYNTREWTCIISRMIRASGSWAHDKNILDYDGWAGRKIIPDGDGWAEVVGYYADGCIKVDVYEIDG